MDNIPSRDSSQKQIWEQKISAWQKSGKSIIEWCRENQELYHRFHYWRVRLGFYQKQQKVPLSFQELIEKQHSALEIHFHDALIKISVEDFDALKTILKAISEINVSHSR